MASTHIYPVTQTRLAGEVIALVRAMRDIDKDLPQLKAILDQIAFGDDYETLAAQLGYASAAEAQTVYNLLTSLNAELNNSSPFWKQVISRMG